MRSTVNRSLSLPTSGFFSKALRSANGMRVRSSSRPLSVTRPLATNSGSPWKIDSGNSSPRGILMPNSRSRRKTMSKKSIDSAPRSPWSVDSGLTSSASTFRASTRVSETLVKISSRVGISPSQPDLVGSAGGRPQAQTAVHRQHLASHVGAVVARQEDGHLGDVLRLADALHRDHFLLDEVAGLVPQRGAHV